MKYEQSISSVTSLAYVGFSCIMRSQFYIVTVDTL